MKLNKLNFRIWPVVAVTGFALWTSSCNNDAESGNTSTDSPTTVMSNNDTMNTITAPMKSDTGSMAGKRAGKISITMPAENKKDKMAPDKMGYYNYAEMSPSFKGGQSAIETYINSNIEYPQDAIDNNIEGTVNVQFGIDENGKITNVKTLGNKIGYGLEDAAVKVINDMGKWTPGQVKGKNVKTWMILPITYRIEG